jgi:type IV pilus assembly protein PilZ
MWERDTFRALSCQRRRGRAAEARDEARRAQAVLVASVGESHAWTKAATALASGAQVGFSTLRPQGVRGRTLRLGSRIVSGDGGRCEKSYVCALAPGLSIMNIRARYTELPLKDLHLRAAGANKPGLLTLTIKDKSALYLAYMPFVKNGGLFIPTNSNYRLGDEVFMLLNLMGEDEKLPVAGRVIWVTPKGAQGKRTAGIGVQFSEQDRGQTQKKIENYLAGALSGDKATHTM